MLEALVASTLSYPGVLLVCSLTGLLFPLPEDLVIMVYGHAAPNAGLAWYPLYAVVCCGMLVRDVLAFLLGKHAGDWLFRQPWLERFLPPKRVEKARVLFQEKGRNAVLIGRLMVGMRVGVYVVGGSMGMRLRTFVLWDVLGIILSAPLLLWLGHEFGEPVIEGFRSVLRHVRSLSILFLGALALVWYIRLRRRSAETP